MIFPNQKTGLDEHFDASYKSGDILGLKKFFIRIAFSVDVPSFKLITAHTKSPETNYNLLFNAE